MREGKKREERGREADIYEKKEKDRWHCVDWYCAAVL